MGGQGDTGHRVDGSVSDSDGLIRGCWLGSSGVGWDTCRHFAAGDCCCWESEHFGGKIGREAARHVDGLRILQVKTSRHRPFEHVGWWQPGCSVSMTAADVIVPPNSSSRSRHAGTIPTIDMFVGTASFATYRCGYALPYFDDQEQLLWSSPGWLEVSRWGAKVSEPHLH